MIRVPQLFFNHHQGNLTVFMTVLTAATGFILFGYDQGVMSSIVVSEPFLDLFPQTRNSSISGITVAIYEIGALMGAIIAMFVGDKLGRKTTVAVGLTVILVGTAIKTSAYTLGQFIAGRIIIGVGTGMNTATIPTYQSECAPPKMRGALVLTSGTLVILGISIAYWVGYGFFYNQTSLAWRIPIVLQAFFALVTFALLFFVPESPSWLVKHGHTAEAKDVLRRLQNVDSPEAPVVRQLMETIEASIAEVDAFQFKDLFTHGPTQNFRRASIGVLSQILQQLSGTNIVSYYASSLFEDSIGLSPHTSRLLAALNGTEFLLAGIVSIFLVDRFGRRITLLGSALGMGIVMVLLTITVNLTDKGNSAASYVAAVLLFVFNTVYACGWLGVPWLYPAECTALGIRAQANAISTCANWLFNFVIVMIAPVCLDHIGSWTYLIFAILNLAVVFPTVYVFFVEPKGRSLEEMDLIFAEAYNEGLSYVAHSLNRPSIAGDELDAELSKAIKSGKDLYAGAEDSQIEHYVGDEKTADLPRRKRLIPLRRLASEPSPKGKHHGPKGILGAAKKVTQPSSRKEVESEVVMHPSGATSTETVAVEESSSAEGEPKKTS